MVALRACGIWLLGSPEQYRTAHARLPTLSISGYCMDTCHGVRGARRKGALVFQLLDIYALRVKQWHP